MSSEVSDLENLRLFDYIIVAATAAVYYDYILTFSREVELIWMKPWSMMSTLFVVARYLGLGLAIALGLGWGYDIFYMSGSMYVCTAISWDISIGYFLSGIAMVQILRWTRLIYILLMDAIMILRVSVMFNRPKRTRQILIFLYSLVTVNIIVFNILWHGSHSGLVIVAIRLIDVSFCSTMSGHSEIAFVYDAIPRIIFDILLMALAVYRFAMHSIEARRMMGKLKINKYMMLLLEHSVLYFLLNFTYEALTIVWSLPSTSMLCVALIALYLNSVPYMIYPRFVLSMKGYRATSGALHVGSEGPRYPRPRGHSESSSVPVTENEEHELSEWMSPRAPQHTRGESC